MTTPVSSYNRAIEAYAKATKGETEQAETRKTDLPDGDFSDLVNSALREARAIGMQGEEMSIQGIRDRADINQVITAVAEAETTLQTVVAVRDKVVEAYKAILQMPM